MSWGLLCSPLSWKIEKNENIKKGCHAAEILNRKLKNGKKSDEAHKKLGIFLP